MQPQHTPTTRRRKPLADRFWAKVLQDGPIPEHCPELGPCWTWLGYINPNGYGMIGSGGHGRPFLAHRVSYEENIGPIPPGMNACHYCDNPGCPNPAHLFLGTQADNMRDMGAKGRAKGAVLRGDGHARSKLTEAIVLLIRARYAAGESIRALAIEYGVGESGVYYAATRRTWQHI